MCMCMCMCVLFCLFMLEGIVSLDKTNLHIFSSQCRLFLRGALGLLWDIAALAGHSDLTG